MIVLVLNIWSAIPVALLCLTVYLSGGSMAAALKGTKSGTFVCMSVLMSIYDVRADLSPRGIRVKTSRNHFFLTSKGNHRSLTTKSLEK